MRISDVTSSYTTLRQLQTLQTLQETQQEQLVTGRKINRLEEDPGAASTVLKTRASRESLVQMRDNGDRADSLAGAGINALEYLKSVSEQAQAIVNDSTVRGTAAAEQVSSLIQDAMGVANTKYGDDYLFGGSASGAAPFALDATTGQVTYSGSGDGRTFNVAEGVNLSPFTSDATNQGIRDFLNNLVSLRDNLASGNTSDLTQIDAGLQQADDSMLEASSGLGFKQSRIEILQTRDAAKYAALDQDETRATAADQTETIVGLLNTQKAYQGALQSVGKINDLSLLNYV